MSGRSRRVKARKRGWQSTGMTRISLETIVAISRVPVKHLMTPPPLPSTTGSRLARIGLWLQLAPLIGIADTMRQVWKAFQPVLDEMRYSGHTDLTVMSRAMSAVIKASLTSSMIGTVVSFIGAALIFIAYLKYKHRPRWATGFLIAFVILGVTSLALAFIPVA